MNATPILILARLSLCQGAGICQNKWAHFVVGVFIGCWQLRLPCKKETTPHYKMRDIFINQPKPRN